MFCPGSPSGFDVIPESSLSGKMNIYGHFYRPWGAETQVKMYLVTLWNSLSTSAVNGESTAVFQRNALPTIRQYCAVVQYLIVVSNMM